MRKVQIAMCVLLALPLAMPAGATDSPTTRTELEQLWQDQIGTALPADVSAAFDEVARHMTPAQAAALNGATESEGTRVYGDVWSVCLSANGGCTVTDNSGTISKDCHQHPIADGLWLYVTIPAEVQVQALGNAVGTWEAHTLELVGGFKSGTITGTSCIVYNDPNIVVVRSNGIVDYEW